jgi:hypothetical protein
MYHESVWLFKENNVLLTSVYCVPEYENAISVLFSFYPAFSWNLRELY